jgi:menaquinone-dependent protoporphyrinogen oxidase
MPHILVLYGTSDGQTTKIARTLGDTLRGCGAEVDIVEAGKGAEPVPEDYAGVIVAASVHMGGYQRRVRRWVRDHAAALKTTPAALVSVSLGILQKDPKVQRDVVAIVERFQEQTEWRPAVIKHIAGAVMYTRYNWFIRRTMRSIAAKAGGDTDTSRDHEYTDWDDLRAFAETFYQRLTNA